MKDDTSDETHVLIKHKQNTPRCSAASVSSGCSLYKQQVLQPSSWRWAGLLFFAMSLGSVVYIVDTPSAIQTQLMSAPHSLNFKEYNLLYVLYYIPSIFLPYFTGMLSDRFGDHICLPIMMALIILGHGLFTLGLLRASFALLLIGRLLESFRGSFTTIMHAANSKQFRYSHLLLSSGILTAVSRLSVTAVSVASPAIYAATTKLWITGAVGLGLGLLSLLSLVIYFIVYRCSLKSHTPFVEAEDKAAEVQTTESVTHFATIKSCKRIVWLYMFLNALGVAVFFAFSFQANDLIHKTFGFTNVEAGAYAGGMHLISGLFIPFFGGIVDRVGRRTQILIVSFTFLLISNLLWMFLPIYEEGSMIILVPLAFCVAFYVTSTSLAWGGLAVLLDKSIVGAMYGIFFGLISITQISLQLVLGVVQEATVDVKFGYFYLSMVLVVLSVVILLLCFWLYVEDKLYNSGKLSRAGTDKKDS